MPESKILKYFRIPIWPKSRYLHHLGTRHQTGLTHICKTKTLTLRLTAKNFGRPKNLGQAERYSRILQISGQTTFRILDMESDKISEIFL